MTADTTATPKKDGHNIATSQTVSYSMSQGLVRWLAQLNTSIAVSSYQSGRFYLIGRNPNGGLLVDERVFGHAMGIAVHGKRLFLATQNALVELYSALQPKQRANGIYDACFIPRRVHLTGAIDMHDVGLTADGSPDFVATRFNCLARLSVDFNFTPIWKPPFVSKIVAEDRCHLNGLAMENGAPAFVTAVSQSDTIDGWRDRRADGGVIIDVASNEIVTAGLSMPHSPRVYNGQLYVLNSGTGELLRINRETGTKEVICFCPGFVRGLAFIDRYAVIGLSRPRYNRFEGLALDDRLRETDSTPWTGIQIIDLQTGTVVEWFRIDGAVAEIYDATLVQGVACGMSLAPNAPELASFITVDDGGASNA